MSLKVLYFARLREIVGIPSEEIPLPQGVADVAALRTWLAVRGKEWQQALDKDRLIRVAVNQELVADNMAIKDGDEVAFFPPVTGG